MLGIIRAVPYPNTKDCHHVSTRRYNSFSLTNKRIGKLFSGGNLMINMCILHADDREIKGVRCLEIFHQRTAQQSHKVTFQRTIPPLSQENQAALPTSNAFKYPCILYPISYTHHKSFMRRFQLSRMLCGCLSPVLV